MSQIFVYETFQHLMAIGLSGLVIGFVSVTIFMNKAIVNTNIKLSGAFGNYLTNKKLHKWMLTINLLFLISVMFFSKYP